jgi:cyclohexyl-isocyanide hydratase
MVPPERHLRIGALIFPALDQLDFTGPFEVLSRTPNSTFHIFARTADPVRDTRGLVLTPDKTYADVPALDVLVVPGGRGVNALMEDGETLSLLRRLAGGAACVFSICTGALLLGAAGLLKGRKATTHWASHDLLPQFGAIAVNGRIVVDGPLVTAAGVTSGLDAALRVVALLRGDEAAQAIQLYLEYSPEPPFACGSPCSAPPAIAGRVREELREITEERRKITSRVAQRLADPG